MSRAPAVIEEFDLSVAWAKAFLAAVERGVRELSPLVVIVNSIEGGVPRETSAIRLALDEALASREMYESHTVSNTIFPQRLWDPGQPRDRLYERYARILPRLRRHPANRNGLYFERLIGLDKSPNQLEHIVTAYHAGIHRRTALQASLFRPDRDHTMQPRRGFPCLNYVGFLPCEGNGLEVTGFYLMQHLLGKAYGNYLGLARLGRFMAHEMGLELRRLVCTSMIAKLDDGVTKGSVAELAHIIERTAEPG